MPLCDDFDDATDVPQHPPSSALWSLVGTAGCGGVGNSGAPTLYPITIDTQFHNSGAQSVKVVGGDSCGPLMINTSAIPKITGGELYGRFYVHLMDTTVSVHHAVIMALGLQADAGLGLNVMDQLSYLELAAENPAGLPSSILLWQTADSNTLPNTDSTGTQSSAYIGASGFTCVEFHTSANTKAVQVWINGTIVPGLTSPPSPPSSNPPMWTPPTPFAPVSFGLGWLSFNNLGMTAWYDDVALSGSRIFCQ